MKYIDYLAFSKKLKSIRIEKDLKQEDIAEALHISSNTYMSYENNPQNFKLSTLEDLGLILGVDLIKIILSFSATKCSE